MLAIPDEVEVSPSGDVLTFRRSHDTSTIAAIPLGVGPMPPYFEIEFLEAAQSVVAIGIGSRLHQGSLPGWDDGTVGYHGDDGKCYLSSKYGKVMGTGFGRAGDVIGCGVDARTGCVYFTRNGTAVSSVMTGVTGYYYPLVGADARAKVRVNFGHDAPFRYGNGAAGQQPQPAQAHYGPAPVQSYGPQAPFQPGPQYGPPQGQYGPQAGSHLMYTSQHSASTGPPPGMYPPMPGQF